MVTPPVYGAIAEKVMVRAPRTVAHAIPGEYGAVAEKVMISPPRKAWTVTRDAYGNLVGCWVVVPARFAVQHRTVMVRAPQVVQGSAGWQPIAPFGARYGVYGGGYAGYGAGFGYAGYGYAGGYGGGAIGALA